MSVKLVVNNESVLVSDVLVLERQSMRSDMLWDCGTNKVDRIVMIMLKLCGTISKKV